ncbi:UNVERIFIED_ORG: O-antigen/teichoic acid export membrane protein [Bacillus sp. B2I3]|nr:O-antigen/teichoic acid export membrane protein [Bacillus sp. B2I3]
MEIVKKNSLGRDAMKLTTSKVITVVISLSTVMLLSRFLTLEEYGTYSQIIMITNLITSLLMLGLPNSISYFLARAENEEEKQKFLSVYYTFSTTLSIIIGIVMVSITPLVVRYFNNDLLNNFFYFLAVYPWAKIIMASIDNVLIVYKRTSLIMIYRIANSFSLLIIILIVQIFNFSFQAYMLLFIINEVVFAISVYIISNSISGKLIINNDKSLIKKILTFSIPIGLATAIGTLNIELDKLMMSIILDTEQLAIYTNASRELPVTIFAISITAVLLPQIVKLLKKGDTKIAIDLWGHSTVLSYIIICFFTTVFFVYAEDVMTLLYSDKFLPGVSVFRVYCLVLLLRCTYFGMILNAKGKTKFIFYSSIASLGINICLNFLLYFFLGIIGPAIATFISMTVIIIFQLTTTSKIIEISFKNIFPWKKLLYITLINISLGGFLVISKLIIPLDEILGSIFESIIMATFFGVAYLILLFKTIKQSWGNLKGDKGLGV